MSEVKNQRAIKATSAMFLAACVCFWIGTPMACAKTITLGLGTGAGTDILGDVVPRIIGGSGGQAGEAAAEVSHLISMSLNTTITVGASLYGRSKNFDPRHIFLPAPTTSGAVLSPSSLMTSPSLPPGTTSLTLPASSTYAYLVADYGGPGAGAEVWDISAVAAGATITIPLFGQPSNGMLVDGYNNGHGSKYQLSSWTLLNPTAAPNLSPSFTQSRVPDGGSTACALGLATLGLATLKRRSW